jgi:hypothetical protein
MRAILWLVATLSLAGISGANAADIKTDDQWIKVKELKAGTEIRIYKKGVVQPILAKAGDATDDKLIVILKNEETALDKKDIERIDARPPAGKRAKVDSKVTTNEPTAQPLDGVRPENYPKAGSSYSSGVSFGSKPDFETIYQRRAAAK